MYQICSYFANNVTEVNRIVAFVKNIIGELELIAVIKTQLKCQESLQINAQGEQRKELDVKRKQPIQMADAIYTKLYKTF